MIYPLKNLLVTQLFGNKNPIYDPLNIVGHGGMDLSAPTGTPIFAAHDGLASYEIDSSAGHGIVIRANDTLDGKRYKTIYWHLVDSSKLPAYRSPIEDGPKQVKQGDLIAYVNNTGLSTGPHLHFGMKFVEQNEPDGDWVNLNSNNGYYGAIDPFPYLPAFKGFNHTFNLSLTKGNLLNNIPEVKALQHGLNLILAGIVNIPETGYYGAVTADAVMRLQTLYNVASQEEIQSLRGSIVGPKTRACLNRFFSR